jgi:DNA-binding response OmpR family regulator
MKKPVLVIEDDADIRESMAEFLDFEGFEPHVASNGREALEILSKAKTLPAVILLDLMMPIMDGQQFRRKQQEDPRIAAIPVIIMSAAPDVSIKRLSLGAADCIKKPIDIDELASMLSRIED